MFKIELENRNFRKTLYFYIVDAGKKWAASGRWHYIVDAEKNGLRALVSALIIMFL